LTPSSQALPGRARQWIVDAMIGGAAALIAITAAHAALPPAKAPLSHARPKPAAAGVAPAAARPAEPAALIAFTDPVPGYAVVSPFGLRKLPWEAGGRLHEGVDIAADNGVPVLAAADGVVVAAGSSDSYGRYVEVQHAEGLKSFYAHLGAIDAGVAPGLQVKLGQPLATIGSSGSSTGPHLHFEIRDAKDRPLNPQYFLDREFAEADDLPLRSAARVPRGVRIAYVSRIPDSKKALMQAREAEKAGKQDHVELARLDTLKGRPHATLRPDDPDAGVQAQRKVLIARLAADQKAAMAAEAHAAPAAASAGADAAALTPTAIPVDAAPAAP
jgi:hypothetical protein